MFELSLNTVLIQTLVLGIISVLLTKKISNILISASTAYWFGWIFLLVCTKIAINNDWLAELGIQPLNYISQLHFGAFFGFFVGTILSTPPKRRTTSHLKLMNQSDFIVNKITNKAIIVLFVLGCIFLISRIRLVGFDMNYFLKVREVYNENSQPFIGWLSTHISVLISFIVILCGITDAKGEMNFKRLLIIILATAPLALSNGSRGFLIGYLIKYLISLLVWREIYGKHKFILTKNEWFKIISYLTISMLLFSVIGFIRGGYGDKLNILYNIVMWPTATTSAMGSWISEALTSNSTNGLLTFGWLAGFIQRIGIADFSSEREVIKSTIDYFYTIGNSAPSAPKSIIPDLIFDFGKNGVFWGILIISFLLQIISISFLGKDLLRHTLAILCIIGAFFTIQISVISSEFAVILIWALAFTLYFRYTKFHYRYYKYYLYRSNKAMLKHTKINYVKAN